eukprot:scaffold396_cov339-Prasinococcus_capsulatus_cf.AAC.16
MSSADANCVFCTGPSVRTRRSSMDAYWAGVLSHALTPSTTISFCDGQSERTRKQQLNAILFRHLVATRTTSCYIHANSLVRTSSASSSSQ